MSTITHVMAFSGVFRNLRGGGTLQVYLFKGVQILAQSFFTLKLVQVFFISEGGRQAQVSHKYAPDGL